MNNKTIERLQDDEIIKELEKIIKGIKFLLENEMTKNHRFLINTFESWMRDNISDRSLTLNLEQLRKSSDDIIITLRSMIAEASKIFKNQLGILKRSDIA